MFSLSLTVDFDLRRDGNDDDDGARLLMFLINIHGFQ